MTKRLSKYEPKGAILGWARERRWVKAMYHLARQTADGRISAERVCGAKLYAYSFIPIEPPAPERRCRRCLFTREYEAWALEMGLIKEAG